MLIATLPPVYREELFREIITCPEIGGVRYNTGMTSPFDPEETLRIIKTLAGHHDKKLWIDLKGRQLRIDRWAMPDYGKITLNHEVEIDGDAWAYFRSGERHVIKLASGNVIYIDPPPRHAVGEGQSLNIVGENVQVIGYLTANDRAYIRAARKLGIKDLMLSFVEKHEDIAEVLAESVDINPDHEFELVLKIESPAGMTFVAELRGSDVVEPYRLMAARDDLFTTAQAAGLSIMECLCQIISKDPQAIVASRIFTGIERDGTLALSDITDIELMKHLDYQHFMLSDEICGRNFREAIAAWKSIN